MIPIFSMRDIMFGLYYTDKDFIQILMRDENGQCLVYATMADANKGKTALLNKIDGILHPRIEYIRTGSWFGSKYAVKKHERDPRIDYDDLKLQLACSIKQIQIHQRKL